MHRTRLSNRLQGYDYSRNALYFVTSCVKDRICCFGVIKDDQMLANEYGQIAKQQWQWLEQQYLYIILHSFVVMPNHIHGVIEIDDRMVGTGRDPSNNENDDHNIGTGRDLSLQQQEQPNNDGDDRLIPQPQETKIKSLSELMGAYKTTSSKQIHLAEMDGIASDRDRSRPVLTFKWQRSFHDHIIRNEESYLRISNYIQNNPSNWKQDKFYK
jgi:putative transposase